MCARPTYGSRGRILVDVFFRLSHQARVQTEAPGGRLRLSNQPMFRRTRWAATQFFQIFGENVFPITRFFPFQYEFLPSRLFPRIRNCSLPQFDTIYRIPQPSPTRRVSIASKCRSTNLKKFSKNQQVAAPGREPPGAAPALSSSAMGKIRASAVPPALFTPFGPSHYSLLNCSFHTNVTIGVYRD